MAAGALKPPPGGNPKGAARKASPGTKESAARARIRAGAMAELVPREGGPTAPGRIRYSPEQQRRLWAAVIVELEDGKTLNQAIKDVPGAPSPVEYLRWAQELSGGAKQYDDARMVGYDKMADRIVEISDEVQVAAVYKGERVELEISPTAVARNRLRVDTRKWLMSKCLPKYRDKTVLTTESGDALTAALLSIASRLPV